MTTTSLTKSGGKELQKLERYQRPEYRVRDADDRFEVEVLMPGVSRNGVEINFERDLLTITGTRTTTIPEGWKAVYSERPLLNYRLQFQLNVEVDNDKISAVMADGVLRVELPKSEATKARTIAVE